MSSQGRVSVCLGRPWIIYIDLRLNKEHGQTISSIGRADGRTNWPIYNIERINSSWPLRSVTVRKTGELSTIRDNGATRFSIQP